MNSTGRRVHTLTKLNNDCNHRNTDWKRLHVSTELLLIWNQGGEKKKSAYFWALAVIPWHFPWAWKKKELTEAGGGSGGFSDGRKVSQLSVLHNNQIPHACEEETS